jgi:tetratricopeptide (TPR) repeat protein
VLAAWLVFLLGALIMRKSIALEGEAPPLKLAWNPRSGASLEVTAEIAAFAAAAFFLIHPGNAETVDYIAATSTTHNTLWALFAFWLFAESVDAAVLDWRYWARLAAMAAAFFGSLLMKEESATIPVAAALYALVFRPPSEAWRDWFRRVAAPLAALFVALAVFLVLYTKLKPPSGALSTMGVSPYAYFLTETWAWLYYLAWIFTPWGYALEHTHLGFNHHWYEPRVLFALCANAAIITLGLRWAFGLRGSRPLRALGFGLGWFYVTILPNSSFFPLTEPVNEHRYYLAYSLLFPGLAYAIWRLAARLGFLAVESNYEGAHRTTVLFTERMKPYALTAAGGALALALVGATLERNYVWGSEERLWRDGIAKDPGNGRAHNNLGIVYLRASRLPEALREFELCSESWNKYKYCFLNQHIAYLGLGRLSEAKAAIDKMTTLDPDFVTGLWYLARFQYEQEKKPDDAIQTLRRCDAIAGGRHLHCLSLLTRVLSEQGRNAELLPVADKAMLLDPGNREVAFTLGLSLVKLSRFTDASKLFGYLVSRDPRDAQALFNLAWTEMQLQNWASARDFLLRHVELAPSEGTWMNLKTVAEKLGDAPLVARCGQELNRIDPRRFPAQAAAAGGAK